MKVFIKKTVERNVKYLLVNAGVRYWEDATVDGVEDESGQLIPFRKGDRWCPTIELETGKVCEWPLGKTAEIYYKVCDDGIYELSTEAGKVESKIEGYVPSILFPEDDGYGDYIIMNIDKDGFISGWKCDNLEEFLQSEETD